jgi:hypothetical protein
MTLKQQLETANAKLKLWDGVCERLEETKAQLEAEREDHLAKREQLTTAFIQDQTERKEALEAKDKELRELREAKYDVETTVAQWDEYRIRAEAAESTLNDPNFVRVPREPTGEQLRAMHRAYWGSYSESQYWNDCSKPLWDKTYHAMLDAAIQSGTSRR